MKKLKLYLVLFWGILMGRTYAQDSTQAHVFHIGKSYDSLKFYSVSMAMSSDNMGRKMFFIERKPVDSATYYKYEITVSNMANCRPCYLKTYNVGDTLVHEGLQYTDCSVGPFIDYYPDGKIRLKGQYRENHSGNWNPNSIVCDIKEGVWTYYNEDGSVQKIEKYKNDKLVK